MLYKSLSQLVASSSSSIKANTTGSTGMNGFQSSNQTALLDAHITDVNVLDIITIDCLDIHL
ncbi:hypothetical protein PPL_08845 [Heterostelium album PN500]|uniref:Uncharacterized protein n=1 Tax=Heterostelium pallidum (strain ATCC 26659 / Pp 5 / PN500) TaxID=670386 RepID=D3BJW5_HETP5|nr:hypothetical protein PPL_08845 [Heterostelium album PN500]EFA78195.1 hypothetical protein PPL_08845 [Heterostelium album PN500]|eukprot:XP_020430321.1 hypothetical protein PPL_08845 [Heterostelium album PN500]